MKWLSLKKLLAMLSVAAGVVSSCPAFAAEEGSDVLSLDGDWDFALPESAAADEWDVLPVPGSWNTFTEYADYIGSAWYKRTVTVPKSWKGRRIYLKFDAVYDIADVWLDGEYLGQHTGGYTPFEFDVTDLVRPGGRYELKLKANNEHVLGAWFQWGGISRSVYLYNKDQLRIVRQKIEPILDVETGTAQVKLLVTVENKGNSRERVNLLADIEEVPDTGFRMSGFVDAGETREFSAQITLNTEQVRPWHFDDPQLYHLSSSLWVKGEELDVLSDRFGVRSVVIKTDGMYLNGEKIRLMGYNRVHDHRAYGNTEPKHLVRADIDRMKRSGANFSRIMHAPVAPDMLDYCDEVGYLLWCEIPIWHEVYRVPMGSREDARKSLDTFPGNALREMIQRDWNHPSIIGWSPGNEMLQESSYYVEEMEPFVRELDPTRLYANVHYLGFSNEQKGGSKGIYAEPVDVLMINGYGSTEQKIKKLLKQHEDVPQLPIFYSEFGETRSESLNHMVDFAPMWERLGKEDYVIGGAHWTYNDYRSYYAKTPASQNRDWGAMDIWRNPKTLYFHFAELQQPVRSIEIARDEKSAEVTITPRGKQEVPSFTLRGYAWTYELLDAKGRVLEGALNELEDIAPEGDVITKSISWSSSDAKQLVVSLINKVGYTLAERRYDLTTDSYTSLPTFPEPANPEVRKVMPLDRSFMVGVTNLEGDKGLEVRYGTSSGAYSEKIEAEVFGAIRVRGLENGETYFGQVRRIEAEGPGPWSPEFSVTPDGGLPPAAPEVLGVVLGETKKAIRLREQEKVEAYKVTLSSGDTQRIDLSVPGLLIVPLEVQRLNAIGPHGISDSVEL
ncbi:glycoside hydrolase family 2 protein [Pelagicoccus mobilis]|uniref:Beta-galactosidase n=1 Tax=Pelagicoccus mobilis TaxID=415221 RepID=A0A934S340_9BACT|nr:glycoside hydrolase family 2 TIM barrel-domain containing protein [Pelagicoccus mobilis]MBK1878937.1 hypothetical protein [Pelagicoccus mobilis]